MRWIFAIIGITLGLPIGLIIGGVPAAMIITAANRTLTIPSLDDYTGLSVAFNLIVLVMILLVTFGCGAIGGLLGYRLGNRLH